MNLSKLILSLLLFTSCLEKKQEEILIDSKINRADVSIKELGTYERKAALEKAKSRQSSVKSLLETSVDPYKGIVSQPEKCLEENLPRQTRIFKEDYFYLANHLYSSKSKILGLCTDLTNLLKTKYVTLYCTNTKKLWLIKYFYSDEDEWKEIPFFKCNN